MDENMSRIALSQRWKAAWQEMSQEEKSRLLASLRSPATLEYVETDSSLVSQIREMESRAEGLQVLCGNMLATLLMEKNRASIHSTLRELAQSWERHYQKITGITIIQASGERLEPQRPYRAQHALDECEMTEEDRKALGIWKREYEPESNVK